MRVKEGEWQVNIEGSAVLPIKPISGRKKERKDVQNQTVASYKLLQKESHEERHSSHQAVEVSTQKRKQQKKRNLSYNKGLTGGLHTSIRRLSKLENLLLTGCCFSGEIPQEIGSLSGLVYLSLDYNSFTGSIPPTIGSLYKLYVLDLTNNKLTTATFYRVASLLL